MKETCRHRIFSFSIFSNVDWWNETITNTFWQIPPHTPRCFIIPVSVIGIILMSETSNGSTIHLISPHHSSFQTAHSNWATSVSEELKWRCCLRLLHHSSQRAGQWFRIVKPKMWNVGDASSQVSGFFKTCIKRFVKIRIRSTHFLCNPWVWGGGGGGGRRRRKARTGGSRLEKGRSKKRGGGAACEGGMIVRGAETVAEQARGGRQRRSSSPPESPSQSWRRRRQSSRGKKSPEHHSPSSCDRDVCCEVRLLCAPAPFSSPHLCQDCAGPAALRRLVGMRGGGGGGRGGSSL